MNQRQITEAYSIVREYEGTNNMILYLKHAVKNKGYVLSEFDIKYVLNNYDFEPVEVNKVFPITKEFGYYLNEKHNIGFNPEKLRITKVIGEMGNSYHLYAQYRNSVPPALMYINKRNIIGEIFAKSYKDVKIDFDRFDAITATSGRKLKEHQKDGVRFMTANRKSILADEMGLGKTTQLIVTALANDYKRVLIIAPASLKTNWKKEIMIYASEDDVTVINGSKWDEAKKFTIINYDILQNFHTVAEEPVMETKEIRDKFGNVVKTMNVPVLVKSKTTGMMVPKMRKSRNKELIKKCLEESPLYQTGFDCIIIDEAQKLSNNTYIRYKTINDLIHKLNPKAVYLSTGTPLTNRPINLYHILRLIDADITSDYKYFVTRYCGGKEMHLRDGRVIMKMDGATNLDELRDKIKHIYIRRLTKDMNDMVEKEVLTEYYDLDEKQMKRYNELWGEYCEARENDTGDDSEQYRQLVEGILVRQYLAREMVEHTIDKVDALIEQGEKVVVITTFQDEMDKFKEYYGKKCVVYNGKMDTKAKDKAQDAFMNNPNVMVIIGNVQAMGVGISLPNARWLFFNSYDWVAATNEQAESRIHRLTQTRDVKCVYQLFTDSISQDMFEKVLYKEMMAKNIIKSENDK